MKKGFNSHILNACGKSLENIVSINAMNSTMRGSNTKCAAKLHGYNVSSEEYFKAKLR